MGGLNIVMDIARRAMAMNQAALRVASNNIANVNTPGYSRQQAILTPARSANSPYGYLGAGVEISQVKRVYDQFVNEQIRQQTSSFAGLSAKSTGLERVEGVFNEMASQGLGAAINDFFNSFMDLSLNPGDAAARASARDRGKAMAMQFNRIQADLQQIQVDANQSIKGTVDEINNLAGQIAELNDTIFRVEINGPANDLRDKRSQLIEELSKKIDLTAFENNYGQIDLLAGGRFPLVQGVRANQMQLIEKSAGTAVFHDVGITQDGENLMNITPYITGGELGGQLELRDTIVPNYANKVNELASAIVAEVNRSHSAGFGLNGTTGVNFFSPFSTTASSLSDKSGLSVIANPKSTVSNPGGAAINSGTVVDRTSLTGKDYEIRFGFVIKAGLNDTLRIKETGAGNAEATIQLTENLAGGSGFALAADLQNKLNADATLNGTYTVAYNSSTSKFTITATAGITSFTLDNSLGTADETLGFTSNPASAASITSDTAVDDDAIYSIFSTSDSPIGAVGTLNNAYTSGSAINFDGLKVIISDYGDRFVVKSGINDKLVFDDGIGASNSLVLSAGVYTGSELATELASKLASSNDSTDTYSVSYDSATRKFTITNTAGNANALDLKFDDPQSFSARLLGFDTGSTVSLAVGSSTNANRATGSPASGDAFTVGTVRDAAKHISVDSAILADANKIAAAQTASAAGDNRNALALADLQNRLLMNDNRATMSDYHGALVGEIGVERSGAKNDEEFESFVLTQLDNRRTSISGVSLDEEMVNLIMYQKAFQGAAQLISIMDEIFDSLLDMVR